MLSEWLRRRPRDRHSTAAGNCLHFIFHSHTTCVHFIICISFAHTLFSLYISHFIRINLFSLLFHISFTYTLFSLNISCILQPLFDVLLGMLGSAYSCSAVKGTCIHLIDILSHPDTKELQILNNCQMLSINTLFAVFRVHCLPL